LTHDSMQYDPIQGHDQGYEPLKVGNFSHFQQPSPHPFTTRAGKWPRILKLWAQYLKLIGAEFLIFVLLFVSRDF